MSRFMCTLLLLWGASAAFAGPKGTVPRSSPTQYPIHAERDGISLGAKLLTRQEARKTFVSDVNSCCTVIEIAVYPDKTKSVDLTLNDFVLRARNSESATKASTAEIAAASIQKNAKEGRDVAVYPSSGIGYESGTVYDPNTGTTPAEAVFIRKLALA